MNESLGPLCHYPCRVSTSNLRLSLGHCYTAWTQGLDQAACPSTNLHKRSSIRTILPPQHETAMTPQLHSYTPRLHPSPAGRAGVTRRPDPQVCWCVRLRLFWAVANQYCLSVQNLAVHTWYGCTTHVALGVPCVDPAFLQSLLHIQADPSTGRRHAHTQG